MAILTTYSGFLLAKISLPESRNRVRRLVIILVTSLISRAICYFS